MKILMLDFDGVLNSVRSAEADQKIINAGKVLVDILSGSPVHSGFDPVAVGLIRRVVDITGARIVISSAWRISLSLTNIRQMFRDEFGWEDVDEVIIGKTPNNDVDNYTRRGTEIEDWLGTNLRDVPSVSYVIVDDSSDMLDHQFRRFVQTCPYDGLSYANYCKILELFNASPTLEPIV